MIIDKIKGHNFFNIFNKKTSSNKKEEVKYSEKKYSSSPINPQYWQAINFRENPQAKEIIIQRLETLKEKDKDFKKSIKNNEDEITTNLAKAITNPKTNEIDDIAQDFLDKFFFETQGLSNVAKICKNKAKMAASIQKYLRLIRDNEGNCNKQNADFLAQILQNGKNYKNLGELSFIDKIKDNQGVVDKNYKEIANTIIPLSSTKSAPYKIESCLKFSKEEFFEIFSLAKDVFKNDELAMEKFSAFHNICYDEDKKPIEKNIDLLKDISDNKPSWLNSIEILDGCINEKDFPRKLFQEKMHEFIDADIEKGFSSFFDCFQVCFSKKGFNDNLFKRAINMAKSSIATGSTVNAIMKYNCLPPKAADDVLNLSSELFDDEIEVFNNLEKLYKTCWSKDKPLKQNILTVKDILQNKPEWYSEVVLLDSLPKFDIEKMHDFMQTEGSFFEFLKCYSVCSDKNKFNDELFKKAIIIQNNKKQNADTAEIIYAIKTVEQNKKLTFKEQIKSLVQLKNLDENLAIQFNLTQAIKNLERSVENNKINEVKNEDKKAFFENFFKVPSSKELSSFEAVMKDSIPTLKSFSDGLPLKYSRDEFLKDLEKLQPGESDFSKLQITPEYEKGRLVGYDGLIYLGDIDSKSKLYEICHKFLYENEVQTDNNKLDKELNSIIKGVPEFINIIGKAQHKTHQYSLDIHSLLVLANSIDNEKYQELGASDKAILKIVCLSHDFAKKEKVVDKEHQLPSSLYARSIASRYFVEPEALDRIYELIKNHHWLEEFDNSIIKNKSAEKIAFDFRRKNDFELAKIFADSDLKSVGDDFYYQHKDTLLSIDKISEKINKIYESASAVFVDSLNKVCLSSQNYEGFNYKVLDFNKIDDNEDLSKYGFEKGKTKKDIRFLVHMVCEYEMNKSFETLNFLSSSLSESALSESIISPQMNTTYQGRKYGVVLDELNTNIVTIKKNNQGSGYEKDYSNIIKLIFDNQDSRNNFKKSLLDNLDINCSNEEYAQFYKENFASRTKLSQIKDDKIFILGNKTFQGKELKQAITKFQDSLLNNISHNEIVGCTPKIKGLIAKAESLEELPKDFLKFARENDFPIVLINDSDNFCDF